MRSEAQESLKNQGVNKELQDAALKEEASE
jgi:hypothetical protein